MRKFSSKLAGQQSGFTLIELVIVIVIIGILAAVAIPNFSSVTDDANKGLVDGVVTSMNSFLSAEKALCQNTTRTCALPAAGVAGTTCASVDDTYIKLKMIQLPFTGGTYATDGTSCKITATVGTKTYTSNAAIIAALLVK